MMQKKDKLLITGGAGYIGSHTVHYLCTVGGYAPDDIVVFDNLVYGHREFLPEGVLFVQGDLCNKEEILAVFATHKIAAVIHFAAYAYVGESMQNPSKYFLNNVVGGVYLLEAMAAHGTKHIVFSSTCATYGMPTIFPITESTPQSPINPYGESKLMFERILSYYDTIFSIKSLCLRYFNASGAGYGIGEAHDPETHLIPLVIETALGKRTHVSVFGTDYDTPDGTCVRDYIHVVDLADAHHKSLLYLQEKNISDQFNVGTGTGTSVQEVIDLVRQCAGHDFLVEKHDRRAGDPAVLVADTTKIQHILGRTSRYTVRDAVASAYDWHTKKIG